MNFIAHSLISDIRKQTGLSQKDFASQYDLSLRALRILEVGGTNVSFDSVLKIFSTLGFDLVPGRLIPLNSVSGEPLNKKEVLGVLLKYLPIVKARFNVESLALFGSLSRGSHRASSDIDILVNFSTDKQLLGQEAQLHQYLLRTLNLREVDLVVASQVSQSFLKKIEGDLTYVA